MGETPQASTAADELRCSECRTLLGQGQERVATDEGAVFCRPCFNNLTAQLQQAIEAQGADINYSMAVLGAVGGGALGVLAWWGFTVLTNVAFGLVAVVIGFTVGKGILMLTGGKRSANLQVLSVAVSLVSFVYANYLVTRSFILEAYADQGLVLPWIPDAALLFEVIRAGFSFMDVVFVAIVVYQAWKIPAPIRLAT